MGCLIEVRAISRLLDGSEGTIDGQRLLLRFNASGAHAHFLNGQPFSSERLTHAPYAGAAMHSVDVQYELRHDVPLYQ
jgi:hypothetical protein